MYYKNSRANVLASLLIFASCVPAYNSSDFRGGASRVSSINVKLPAVEQLVATDGSKPVNGMHLKIAPVDAACAEATKVNQYIVATKLVSIQEKIRKGCDYNISVELGKLDSTSSPTKMTDVYYAPTQPSLVTAQMTKDDKIPLSLSLAITDAGRKIGLPEKQQFGDPIPQQPPAPQPLPEQPPTPQPQPQNPGLTDLPSNLNVNLSSSAGAVPLKQIFSKKYMLVDFSRPGCGPCVNMAEQLDNDTQFRSLFADNSNCTFMSVIPPDQLSDWKDVVGQNSWTASHSYEYSGSHSRFGQLFGFQVTSTPTFLLVDRTGKVVKNSSGGLPSGLSTMCQ
jgi:thioredoxin-related protein